MLLLTNEHYTFLIFKHNKKALYPTLMGSKTPTSNSAKAKNLGRGWAAHKSPIRED